MLVAYAGPVEIGLCEWIIFLVLFYGCVTVLSDTIPEDILLNYLSLVSWGGWSWALLNWVGILFSVTDILCLRGGKMFLFLSS